MDHESGEYGVVQWGEGWGSLSLALFAAALGARFLVGLLPPELRPYPWGAALKALSVPFFSGLGMVAALLGSRGTEKSSIARLGLLVNAIAFALSILALAAILYLIPSRPDPQTGTNRGGDCRVLPC